LTERRLLAAVESIEKRLKRLEEQVIGRKPEAADAIPPATAHAPSALADLMLGGAIDQSMLADILQMLSSNLASGEFIVKGGETQVSLFFSEGQIVHAVGPGVTGEQAVFAALAIESGTFTMRRVAELPKERSVQSKAQFLILEALRRIDEAHADAGKGKP
jgi:Ethanolamine utilization protein EutJ (predicted chaperonin)